MFTNVIALKPDYQKMQLARKKKTYAKYIEPGKNVTGQHRELERRDVTNHLEK